MNLLKHRFVSAKSDGSDATQIQPSNWNDGHKFSGGNLYEILQCDPTDANYGAKWLGGWTVDSLGGYLNNAGGQISIVSCSLRHLVFGRMLCLHMVANLTLSSSQTTIGLTVPLGAVLETRWPITIYTAAGYEVGIAVAFPDGAAALQFYRNAGAFAAGNNQLWLNAIIPFQ